MKEVVANAATQDRSSLLQLEHVGKIYGGKDAVTCALNDISLTVDQREFVAIMGPSCSGKSTLLNCIATIDTLTSGRIVLAGRDITLARSGVSKISPRSTGIHFPGFQLAGHVDRV